MSSPNSLPSNFTSILVQFFDASHPQVSYLDLNCERFFERGFGLFIFNNFTTPKQNS